MANDNVGVAQEPSNTTDKGGSSGSEAARQPDTRPGNEADTRPGSDTGSENAADPEVPNFGDTTVGQSIPIKT